MLQIRARFSVPHYARRQHRRALEVALDEGVRRAAERFLRVAWPRVPSYTGTSRGSMLALARFLHVHIDIPEDREARKKHPGQGPALGQELGQAGDFIQRDGLRARFRFSQEVPWFQFLDLHSASEAEPYRAMHLRTATPWHSMEAGRVAFKDYVRRAVRRRMPKTADFITWSRVEVK